MQPPPMNYFAPYEQTWTALFQGIGWDPGQKHVAIEVGSWEGDSASWIVTNLLRHPESRLYCVDPWAEPEMQLRHERFRARIAGLPDPAKVVERRAYSRQGLMDLTREGVQADLVYIDGSHEAPDVLTDLVLAFGLARMGGLIICDDYLWADARLDRGSVLGRPKIAVDAFTTIFSDKIRWVFRFPNDQVAFAKIAD